MLSVLTISLSLFPASPVELEMLLDIVGNGGVLLPLVELVLPNMSLILRRWLNSGMRRPDNARLSLGERSRCRDPPLNMPSGFIMSYMLTFAELRETSSLKTA